MSAEKDNNLKRKSPIKQHTSEKKINKNIELEEINTEPLTCSLSSNNSIFFKIIHSKEEFDNFHKLNLENTFQPKYSLQLFPNEKISGYKGLKILISLTPKFFTPHIKIIYDKVLRFKDNLEEILQKHYKDSYLTDDNKFLQILKEENEKEEIKGKLIFKEEEKEIYYIDILNDDFKKENYQFQALCTFFIDAASFIPLESNFWGYFVIINRKKNDNKNWFTIGFSSFRNFHLELYKYCSMISQFLILIPYQRKGYGTFLLENIYYYFNKNDNECIEITTEDPGIEFILMRDYTIIKILLKEKILDDILKLLGDDKEIKTKEIYEKFTFSKVKLKEIAKSLKLQNNLIERAFEIIKFSLCSHNLLPVFEKEKRESLKNLLRNEYQVDSLFKDKKYGPFIFFFDDPDFDYLKIIEEDKKNMNGELSLEQKINVLFIDYDNDIRKILSKCGKAILDYKDSLK